MERTNNYNDLKPFRFWCQKVLPLVYDDSLSYYELLDKVIDYLNKTMEDVTVLNDDTEALYAAYNQLQSYVNNYFDNLDVQQEIDNKLDTMVLNGTLTRLVRPFVGEAVENWLEDNVEPTGSVVLLDTTMTVRGAAADAEAVGDLKSAIEQIYSDNSIKSKMIDGELEYTEEKSYPVTFNTGYTTNSGATDSSATSYVTTGFLLNENLPDSIDVYGLVSDNTLSAVVNQTTATPPAYSGWLWSNLPVSFMVKHDGYVTIDIAYARTHFSKGLSFNFYANASDKSIRYIETKTNTVKRLKWVNNNRVVVDANGNGDYTTIQSAVDAVAEGDEIVILPGTYNESVNTRYKYVYLHGMGANVTKIVNNSGDYKTPPLWMCKGIIEGLTIYAEKTESVSPSRYSYALHLDSHWGTDADMRSLLIKNCIIKSDFAGPIGCGVIDGCKVTIENSIIISTGITSDAVTAFQIHGNEQGTGSAEFIIKNTVLQSPTTSNAKGILFTNGGSSHNTGTTFNLLIINSVMTRFYNSCGDLLTINPMSYGNNVIPLNVAQEYESIT